MNVDQKWRAVARSLLPVRSEREDESPSRTTIRRVLYWLRVMRHKSPETPPLSIHREPAGGLIVEWDDAWGMRHELTIPNGRGADRTIYGKGTILTGHTEIWGLSSTSRLVAWAFTFDHIWYYTPDGQCVARSTRDKAIFHMQRKRGVDRIEEVLGCRREFLWQRDKTDEGEGEG